MMNAKEYRREFIKEVESFIKASGISATVLGRDALGTPHFVHRLRKGAKSSPETIDKVRAFMAKRLA